MEGKCAWRDGEIREIISQGLRQCARGSHVDRKISGLLLRAWDRLESETETADAEEALTPHGAVDLLIRLMPPGNAERNAADGLLVLREDIRNPQLRARGAQWGRTLARALGRRFPTINIRRNGLAGRWRQSGRVRTRGGH